MLLPITPRPMNPRFAIIHLELESRFCLLYVRRVFCIFRHLAKMVAHQLSCRVGVASFHRCQNAFVMELAAFRPTFHAEDLHALFAQQSHD